MATIKKIVQVFMEWFESSNHAENEAFFEDEITLERLQNLSREGFIDLFFWFASEGGRIQSGGHRTARSFGDEVEKNYDTFRLRVLEPFQKDFNLDDWLTWAETIPYFSPGLCTIYLNRVAKHRYVIVNQKSIAGYELLSGQKAPAKFVEKYRAIEAFEKKLLKNFPVLQNFFRVDTLMHFLIGTEEGKKYQHTIAEENPQRGEAYKNQWNMPNLNTILYGPPGTGKTYQTKRLALQIIEGKSAEELSEKYPSGDAFKEAFERYQESGQIGFVTFHQSFGYEDFVEGIKPHMREREMDDPDAASIQEGQLSLSYAIEDGILKTMAEKAESYQAFAAETQKLSFRHELVADLEDKRFFKMSLGNSMDEGGQEIYRHCVNKDCIALGWGQHIDFTDADDEQQIKSLFQEHGGAASKYEIVAVKCFKFWMRSGDIVFVSDGNLKVRAVGVIESPYYYDPDSPIPYNHFRKVKWLIRDTSIPVDQVYGKKFSQQTIYQMWTHLVKRDFFNTPPKADAIPQKHVLIIDEINRGNIASIFGELITLIETDKRKGQNEAISVLLPYSKRPFSLPSNLYLLGTMNTADRSVEALDTALRRRFSFVHMKPEPEHLEPTQEGIDLQEMLKILNQRLEILIDADHTIGHAWLWNVKDLDGLRMAFKDKILPLLQEFFYNDYEKIGLVLGEKFVAYENVKARIFARFNGGSDLRNEYADRVLYRVTEPLSWDEAAFRSIYTTNQEKA
jgi:hypothetical protein